MNYVNFHHTLSSEQKTLFKQFKTFHENLNIFCISRYNKNSTGIKLKTSISKEFHTYQLIFNKINFNRIFLQNSESENPLWT